MKIKSFPNLPKLTDAEKAVITPEHPIVTVKKNFMQNKKFR